MARKRKDRKKKHQQGKLKTWQLVCIGLAVLVTAPLLMPTYLLTAVLMAPTLVAWFVDRDPKRYLGRSVLSVNVCGALPAILDLWFQGQTLTVFGGILGNIFYWLSAYGSAAIGWLLFAFVPRAIGRFVAVKALRSIHNLRDKQQQLVDEWGEDVTIEVRSYLESQDGQEMLKGPDEDAVDEALPPPPPDQGDVGDLPEFDIDELGTKKQPAAI